MDLVAKRIPSLDGWRAISIFLVLGSHSIVTVGFPQEWEPTFDWIFYGNLGVRVFFVISGLIITWLMLVESATKGTVNLKNFYVRRALRIFPVCFAFLGVVAALQFFTDFQQSRGQWLRNITFTTGLPIFGGETSWTTGHLWSLAVEEQFYIVWPILFVLLMLAKRWRLSAVVLLVPCVIAAISNVVRHQNLSPVGWELVFGQRSFMVNFDALAVGCGAAILLFHKADLVRKFFTSRPGLLGSLSLAFVVVPHVSGKLHILGPLIVPFGPTIQACGIAGLILQSIVQPGWGFYRLLNVGVVAWVGTLSYSLYIWQQLFCSQPDSFGWPNVWWMSFPGWLVATFIAACASYYLLEKPIMSLRARFRS